MNIEDIRTFCLAKPGATEDMPFGDDTLVFRVYSRIFLLLPLKPPLTFNVKCEPEKAIALREEHDAILPGFHMNKKHWNTVWVDGRLSPELIHEQISHSYERVLSSVAPKKRI